MLPRGSKWLSTKILQFCKIYFALSCVVQMSCDLFCLCQTVFLSPWGNASTCLLCPSSGKARGLKRELYFHPGAASGFTTSPWKSAKTEQSCLISVWPGKRQEKVEVLWGERNTLPKIWDLPVPPHNVAFPAADSPPHKDMKPLGALECFFCVSILNSHGVTH